MRAPKTDLWIAVLAFMAAVGVTVLDHFPAWTSVPWHGLFVIPVIWIAVWSAEDDVFLLTGMALIVTGLTLLPILTSFGGGGAASLIDRVVTLAAIWLTVLISLLRKRAQRTYKWINLAGRR